MFVSVRSRLEVKGLIALGAALAVGLAGLVAPTAHAAPAVSGVPTGSLGLNVLEADLRVTQVAAGLAHSLALAEDGTVWAWGLGGSGQLGDGDTESRYLPVQVTKSYFDDGPLPVFTTISAGSMHSLARAEDGTVWAWGHGNFGQLGDGDTENRYRPVQITESFDDDQVPLSAFTAISAGAGHSLALDVYGRVWAWGNGASGQLGDAQGYQPGHHRSQPWPVLWGAVGPLPAFTAISAGAGHSLAVAEDGTAWAWGMDMGGQLGVGHTWPWNRYRPVQITESDAGQAPLPTFAAISAGSNHSLALAEDGTVWAWGHNGSGLLGVGQTTEFEVRYRPVQGLDIGLDVPVCSLPDVATFVDVPFGAPFYRYIEWLYCMGITRGYLQPDGTREFRPANSVHRGAMAAFMYRLSGLTG